MVKVSLMRAGEAKKEGSVQFLESGCERRRGSVSLSNSSSRDQDWERQSEVT